MESIVYVTEAAALIEGIHILKQWVYHEEVQLIVPLCSLTAVQEAYKTSLAPKDEPAPRQSIVKSTGRSTRKEYPLFDINPRTTWEFLERAKSEKGGIPGVAIQCDNEVFTKWKDEEEKKKTTQAEIAMPPPSSFADALLRKLTMKESKEEAEGPAKPKLIARSKDSRPVWKINQTPSFSSHGLTEKEKSLLSCVLWRVYDTETDPLRPVEYILLVRSQDLKLKASAIGIHAITLTDLEEKFAKQQREHENRNAIGELEKMFPEVLTLSRALLAEQDRVQTSHDDSDPLEQRHEVQLSAENDPTEFNVVPTHRISSNPAALASALSQANQSGNVQEPCLEHSEKVIETKNVGVPQEVKSDISVSRVMIEDKDTPNARDSGKDIQRAARNKTPPQSTTAAVDSESELDSDEEIIVFNPRNRRMSGLNGSRSRPGSSNEVFQKTYKAGVQTNSRPVTAVEPVSMDSKLDAAFEFDGNNLLPRGLLDSMDQPDAPRSMSQLGVKQSPESKLKPQSPVFTPGQPFISSLLSVSTNTGALHSPSNSIEMIPPTGPRARQQRMIAPRHDSEEMLRVQKENSQRIIQRQREAIQRQSRATEAPAKAVEQSSPRLIQMEPTDNPTMIDPDAFDRSYVVQQPSSKNNSPRRSGENRRSRGNHNRGKPKQSSRPVSRAAEPDVDFVLKSGAPRGSIRGRGKLWVP